MARTKAEIRAFLDSQVGTIVPHPGYPDLNGQCVTLTKALMAFLGVPNPYAARGDAINAGDTYIRQGLGTAGKGWLTIVVNRDMGYIDGVHYGHIWVDLQGEANYESNGARALHTTKNTRPISQGQQFVNFDEWVIEGDSDMITKNDLYPVRVVMSEVEGWNMNDIHSGKDDATIMGAWVGRSWQDFIMNGWNVQPAHRGWLVQQIAELNTQIGALSQRPTKAEMDAVKQSMTDLQKAAEDAQKATAESKAEYEKLAAQTKADQETGNSFLRWLGNQLNKLMGKG